MRDRGRLTAPGDLLNEAVFAPEPDALGEPEEDSRSLAELAAQYGLRPSSERPGLASYLAMVWQRRHFIIAYATARNVSTALDRLPGPDRAAPARRAPGLAAGAGHPGLQGARRGPRYSRPAAARNPGRRAADPLAPTSARPAGPFHDHEQFGTHSARFCSRS